MLDANARHIAAGREFFVEVRSCSKDSLLYPHGVRRGDVLLCTMISEESEDPEVSFKIGEETVTLRCGSNLYDWIVYSGGPHGSGFISDRIKAKAKAIIGDWYE